MTKVLMDTNVLLDGFTLEDEYSYVLLSHVNRELEDHKRKGNDELKHKARQAVRLISENIDRFEFDIKDYKVEFNKDYDEQYTDNKIIQACLDNNYSLMTNDLLLQHKAEAYGIPLIEGKEVIEDDYSGYKVVTPTEEQYSTLYSHPKINTFDLITNQYLVIKDPHGNEEALFKWNGQKHIDVLRESYDLDNDYFGKFKCKDLYQRAAVDSLIHNDVTMIRGKAGSGKSLISLAYALKRLNKKKLVIFINNVPVANSREQGFYKGTKTEKLKQSNVGSILTSKLGGEDAIDALIATGQLLLLPFSDLRGYDSDKDSIVWITESQNLDISLMKLALQRLGEGSKMIIDGDDKTQVDSYVYAGSRNGMKRLSKVFRGELCYGEVELTKVYRSKVAEIADKM